MQKKVVSNKISFICGTKWTLRSADLATGFVVFLYNLGYKKAECNFSFEKTLEGNSRKK